MTVALLLLAWMALSFVLAPIAGAFIAAGNPSGDLPDSVDTPAGVMFAAGAAPTTPDGGAGQTTTQPRHHQR